MSIHLRGLMAFPAALAVASAATESWRSKAPQFHRALVAAGVLALLSGCAAIDRRNVSETEQRLSAAGFAMQPANTAERQANLKALKPHEISAHTRGDDVYYVYADPEFCNCLYVGDQKAYQTYENLTLQERIARMNEEAALDWGTWGPYPWGW